MPSPNHDKSPYEVTDEIVDALADRAVTRGLELARLRAVRDGYMAAAKTLAALVTTHGAGQDDITQAIAAVVVDLDSSGRTVNFGDALEKARMQVDGCRNICQELLELGSQLGADRDELLDAVRDTVYLNARLRSASTPEDLGFL